MVLSEGFNSLLTQIQIQKYPIASCGRPWCLLAGTLSCLQSRLRSQRRGCFQLYAWRGEQRCPVIAPLTGMAGRTAAKFILPFGPGPTVFENGEVLIKFLWKWVGWWAPPHLSPHRSVSWPGKVMQKLGSNNAPVPAADLMGAPGWLSSLPS